MKTKKVPPKRLSAPVQPVVELVSRLSNGTMEDMIAAIEKFGEWTWPKADFFHWIPVLNRFDSLLESICAEYDLKEPQIKPFTVDAKRQLMAVLNFTRILWDNCSNRNIYASYEHLHLILHSHDFQVVELVLRLLLRPAGRITTQRPLRGNLSVFQEDLIVLSQHFGVSRENSDLAQLVKPEAKVPDDWLSIVFKFYASTTHSASNAALDVSSTPVKVESPNADASQGCRGENIAKLAVKTDKQSSAPAYRVSKIVADDVTCINITLPSLAGIPFYEVYRDVVDQVPEAQRLDLFHKLRIAACVENFPERASLLQIRLLALAVLTSIVNEEVARSKILVYEPDLIGQMAHLLELGTAAPLKIQVAAICVLESMSHYRTGLPNVLTSLNVSANHGILMYVLRKVVSELEEEASSFSGEFVDAFFSFVSFLIDTDSGGMGLISGGFIQTLVPVLSNHRPEHMKQVTKCIGMLDNIVNRFTNSINPFANANGLDILVSRIKEEVDSVTAMPPSADSTSVPHEKLQFLRAMLKFILHLMQIAGSADHIRNLIETSLPKSLNLIFQRVNTFGAGVFGIAIGILSTFIHNEPTCLSILQDASLPQSLLNACQSSYPVSAEIISALPNAFGAICLNAQGLQMFQEQSPIHNYLMLFASPLGLKHLVDNDVPSIIGGNVDELIRHHPGLREGVLLQVIELFDFLCSSSSQYFVESETRLHPTDGSPPDTSAGASKVAEQKSDAEGEVTVSVTATEEPPFTATATGLETRDGSEMDLDAGWSTNESVLDKKEETPLTTFLSFVDISCRFAESLFQNASHAKEFIKLDGLNSLFTLSVLPVLPVNFLSTAAAASLSYLFRILIEVQNTAVIEGTVAGVNRCFADMKALVSDGELESLCTKLITHPETDRAQSFLRVLLNTAVYSGLMCDLFYAHCGSQSKSLAAVCNTFTTDEGASALQALGLLHRLTSWEILDLESNFSSLWFEPHKATTEQEKLLLKSPMYLNVQIFKSVLKKISASLTPTFHGIVKSLCNRRSPESSQRDLITKVLKLLCEILKGNLSWTHVRESKAAHKWAYYDVFLNYIRLLLIDERNKKQLQLVFVLALIRHGVLDEMAVCFNLFFEELRQLLAGDLDGVVSKHLTVGLNVFANVASLLADTKLLTESSSYNRLVSYNQSHSLVVPKEGDFDFFQKDFYVAEMLLFFGEPLLELWNDAVLDKLPPNLLKALLHAVLTMLKATVRKSLLNGSDSEATSSGDTIGELRRFVEPSEPFRSAGTMSGGVMRAGNVSPGRTGGRMNNAGNSGLDSDLLTRIAMFETAMSNLITQAQGSSSANAAVTSRSRATVTADPALVTALEEMGFSKSAAERALIATGNQSDQAVEYILSHPELNDAPTISGASESLAVGAEASVPVAQETSTSSVAGNAESVDVSGSSNVGDNGPPTAVSSITGGVIPNGQRAQDSVSAAPIPSLTAVAEPDMAADEPMDDEPDSVTGESAANSPMSLGETANSLVQALTMSFGAGGPSIGSVGLTKDRKRKVNANEAEHINKEQEVKYKALIEKVDKLRSELRNTVLQQCLKLLDGCDQLLFSVVELYKFVADEDVEEVVLALMKNVQSLMVELANSPVEERSLEKLSKRFRLLALLANDPKLQDRFVRAYQPFAKEVLAKLLDINLDALVESSYRPVWVSGALLVIESYISVVDEPQPETLKYKVEGRSMEPVDAKGRVQSFELDQLKKLVSACLKFLSAENAGNDWAEGSMRLLVRLTRHHELAMHLVKDNGLQVLFYPQWIGKYPTHQELTVLVLRHIMEDKETLQKVMEHKIKDFFHNPLRAYDVAIFLKHLAALACRDPDIFVEAVKSTCQLSSYREGNSALISLKKEASTAKAEDANVTDVQLKSEQALSVGVGMSSTSASEESLMSISESTAESSEGIRQVMEFLVTQISKLAHLVNHDTSGAPKPATATESSSATAKESAIDVAVSESKNGSETSLSTKEAIFNHLQHVFAMQCLSELVLTFPESRKDLFDCCQKLYGVANLRQGSASSLASIYSTKHKGKDNWFLAHLLMDVLPYNNVELAANVTNFKASFDDAPLEKRLQLESSWAISLLTSLCRGVDSWTIERERFGELTVIRRTVFEHIVRAMKCAVESNEPRNRRYGRYLALVDLTERILSSFVNFNALDATAQQNTAEYKLQCAKLMFDKGFVPCLAAMAYDVDPQHPCAKSLIESTIQCLRGLSEQAKKLGEKETEHRPSSLFPANAHGKNAASDEHDEIHRSHDDEDAPHTSNDEEENAAIYDLTRNSALGVFHAQHNEDDDDDEDFTDDDEEDDDDADDDNEDEGLDDVNVNEAYDDFTSSNDDMEDDDASQTDDSADDMEIVVPNNFHHHSGSVDSESETDSDDDDEESDDESLNETDDDEIEEVSTFSGGSGEEAPVSEVGRVIDEADSHLSNPTLFPVEHTDQLSVRAPNDGTQPGIITDASEMENHPAVSLVARDRTHVANILASAGSLRNPSRFENEVDEYDDEGDLDDYNEADDNVDDFLEDFDDWEDPFYEDVDFVSRGRHAASVEDGGLSGMLRRNRAGAPRTRLLQPYIISFGTGGAPASEGRSLYGRQANLGNSFLDDDFLRVNSRPAMSVPFGLPSTSAGVGFGVGSRDLPVSFGQAALLTDNSASTDTALFDEGPLDIWQPISNGGSSAASAGGGVGERASGNAGQTLGMLLEQLRHFSPAGGSGGAALGGPMALLEEIFSRTTVTSVRRTGDHFEIVASDVPEGGGSGSRGGVGASGSSQLESPTSPLDQQVATLSKFTTLSSHQRFLEEAQFMYGKNFHDKAVSVLDKLYNAMIPLYLEAKAKADIEEAKQKALEAEEKAKAEAEAKSKIALEDPAKATDSKACDSDVGASDNAAGGPSEPPTANDSTEKRVVTIRGRVYDITETDIDPTFLDALPDEMKEEVVQEQLQELARRRIMNDDATGRSGGLMSNNSVADYNTFASMLNDPNVAETLMDVEDSGRMTSDLLRRNPGSRALVAQSAVDTAATSTDTKSKKRPIRANAVRLFNRAGLLMILKMVFLPEEISRSRLNTLLVNLSENAETRTELITALLAALIDSRNHALSLPVPRAGVVPVTPISATSIPSAASGGSSMLQTPKSAKKRSTNSLLPQNIVSAGFFDTGIDAIPLLIQQRCLDTLCHIVSKSDQNAIFCLLESDQFPQMLQQLSGPNHGAHGTTVHSAKKGKAKSVSLPAKSSPLVVLLNLLDRTEFQTNISLLESLGSLLSCIFRQLVRLGERATFRINSQLKAAKGSQSLEEKNEVGSVNKGKSKVAKCAEAEPAKDTATKKDGSESRQTAPADAPHGANDIDWSSAEVRKLIKELPHNLQPPSVPEKRFKSVVRVLCLDECSNKAFAYALVMIQSLCSLPRGRDFVTEELIAQAGRLGSDLVGPLQDLTALLANASSAVDVHGETFAKFSSANAKQAKLLRLLKALDFIENPKNAKPVFPGVPHALLDDTWGNLSSLYNQKGLTDALLPLWQALGHSLAAIDQKDNLIPIATVLLPLIESFLVVSKPFVHVPLKSAPMFDLFSHFTETHRKILNHMVRNTPSLMSGSFALLVKNPKVLEFDTKRTYFQQTLHKKSSRQGNRSVLHVSVHRDNVFQESFNQMERISDEQLKNGKLSIKFKNEEGVDAGGVTREWFSVLSRAMFNPDYAMFKPSVGDKVTYQPNRLSSIHSAHLQLFAFVGRIIAKAVYEGYLLDCYFTRSFYKHILGVPVVYKDMEAVDPDYYKSLEWMLENDITGVLDLTFSVEMDTLGRKEIKDLKPNGRNIAVTEANKTEYVQLVTKNHLTDTIESQLKAFLRGFYAIVPKDLVAIFNEQELELLISGLPEIDIDDWKNNTDYHNYSSSSPQVQWFWRAVRSFTQEERAKLLQFVTGTSKVPLNGFSQLQGVNGVTKFNIHRDFKSNERLPSAHTCFNQLDLPLYDSYEQLRATLLIAISECSGGFGFA